MERERLLKRVKSLLDMAADTSSPNEAMIAARRARTLMDQHNISIMEVEQSVGEKFGAQYGAKVYINFPIWHQVIGANVATYNDTIADLQLDTELGKYKFRFRGRESDAIVAAFMLDYLIDQGNRQSSRLCKEYRHSYKTGFAHGVRQKILELMAEREELKASDGRSLVVTRMAAVESEFGEAKYRESSRITKVKSNAAAAAGFAAGKSVNLNQGIGTDDAPLAINGVSTNAN